MTALNHALTGAAIGMAVQQPLLVIPLAFVSHFVLDIVPHFEQKNYTFGTKSTIITHVVDGLLTLSALVFLGFFAPHLMFPAVLGAIFAMLPDAFWLHYYTHGRPQYWFYRFHQKIQWFERPQGMLVEVSYLVFIGFVITAIR